MDYILLGLEHIYNLCIDKAIWPKALKKAEIIPIYKADDKTVPKNYRPMSLISNFAKIFEKIVHTRMDKFVNKYNI